MKIKRISTLMAVTIFMFLSVGCSITESDKSSVYESAENSSTEELISTVKNPLTGELGYNEKAVGKRPAAVMINNIKASLPQYGIDSADIIYELPVEGGITRLMGVYADYTKVPYICSVRSCRYYYPIIAFGMDAFYCHWGMDKTIALDTLNRLDIDRFDGNDSSLGAGTVFVRDSEREESYASEHTGALDGSVLESAVSEMGYRTEINEINKNGAFIFNSPDSPVVPNGSACMKAELTFSPEYFSTFEYDGEKEIYLKFHSGTEHCDGKSGKQLEFKNVFALETEMSVRNAKKLLDIDLSGGNGYYISMGRAEPITWNKESDEYPIRFFDKNGNELKINSGKSYIGFIESGEINLE